MAVHLLVCFPSFLTGSTWSAWHPWLPWIKRTSCKYIDNTAMCVSYRIISSLIVSYRIVSYHIISYHISYDIMI